MKNKALTFLTTFILITCLCERSFANLVINGDFESSDVRTNTWRWFTADNVDGWEGSNVEVWDSFRGIDAYSGTQFAELNAHANRGQAFTIFQSLQTEIDNLYDLTFAYRARRNNSEAFSVSLSTDSTLLFSNTLTDHTTSNWSIFRHQFVATSELTRISFTSIFPRKGTVGNFLDDIQVVEHPTLTTQSALVSGPTTAGLFALSFVLITAFFYRRKRQA